jgi:hypothetical protein
MDFQRKKVKRGITTVTAFLIAFTVVAFAPVQAFAQTPPFELDGNADSNGFLGSDWDLVNAGGDGARAWTGVIRDLPEPAFAQLTGGKSKDIYDFPLWRHRSGSPPDKDDITNAYAALFEDEILHEFYLVFGMDRFDTSGDAQLGFWFLKDDVQAIAGGDFSGAHQNGDLLVLVNFSQGGTVPNIEVWMWMDGTVIPTAVGGSVECANGVIPPGSDLCGIVNATNVPAPWAYENKDFGPTDTFPPGAFFEGAINLSVATPDMACFTHFLVESRSSTSINATLKDFASGGFPVCGLDVYLACSAGSSFVDADGVSVVSTYEVELENDGVGTVFDLTLREDVTLEPGESCAIISVAGAALVTPVDLPSGVDVVIPLVPSQIDPFNSVTLEVQCDTFKNPLVNAFTAKAATTDGGDLTLNYSEAMTVGEASACSVVPNRQASIETTCQDVRLMKMDGTLVVEVLVDITVTNTGEERLNNVSVDDDRLGNLIAGATLDPGESIIFQDQSYIPSAPDQEPIAGTSDKYDPHTAMFTNTVTVEGEGEISGELLDPFPFDSTTCELCQ